MDRPVQCAFFLRAQIHHSRQVMVFSPKDSSTHPLVCTLPQYSSQS